MEIHLKHKRLMVLLFAAGVLLACSKPTDTIIPSDMSKWDSELAPAITKLSEEDKKLATGYLMRAKMGELFGKEGIPIGTTLGAALESQKKWLADQVVKEAEAKALKERMLKEQQKAREDIENAVTVALIAKHELPKNYELGRYSEVQLFKFGIKNKSEKEIAGVSGEMEFIDIFDKKVGSVTFRMAEKIKPGGEVTWEGGRDYNQFISEHKAVWNLEEGKYKTKFVPSAIVFADGSQLKTPD